MQLEEGKLRRQEAERREGKLKAEKPNWWRVWSEKLWEWFVWLWNGFKIGFVVVVVGLFEIVMWLFEIVVWLFEIVVGFVVFLVVLGVVFLKFGGWVVLVFLLFLLAVL